MAATFVKENSVAAAVLTGTWLRFAILATPLIGATFLSKFAIPPFGALGMGISIFLVLAALIVGAFSGCVGLDSRRLTFYLLLIGFLGLIQLLQPNAFSILSLLLLAAIHVPYVFNVRDSGDGERIIKFFLSIVTIFAWCGIAQFSLHFFVDPRFLYPIENFVPDTFIVQHFNHQAAVEYGSHDYRANGVFLLEPSFFSQVLAVAIVAELCTQGRALRLALFFLALLVSYSGTGIIVLAICLPLVIVARRRWGLLLIGIIALAALIPLQEYLHLDRLLSRVHEFGTVRSSAYSRFVGGFELFDLYLWHDPWRTLFGYGAGSFTDYATRAHGVGGEIALFKIVFEFGLVGGVAYFGFLFCCLFYSPAPRLLTLAVGITYLLNGIYIPFAHGLALSLLLWNSASANNSRAEWLAGPARKRSAGALAESDPVPNSQAPLLAPKAAM